MAISASKSVDLNSGSGYKYGLNAYFVENSTNVADNTSNITVIATLQSKGASWSSSYNSPLRIYWHDNRENYDRLVATNDIKSLGINASATASGTINVTHNNDGSLSGYAYATFTKAANTSWCPNSGGVATDWTGLTMIPRASVPSIKTYPNNTPDFNIGDTITIHMNRKSSNFTHAVYMDFGDEHFLIGQNVADNIQFNTSTIADSMYEIIPNANVGEGQIRVITYNGSTQVGTATCIFYAHVTNANPTFSKSYEDTNATVVAITGNNQQIVRNQSTLRVNVTNLSAKKYATISSVICEVNSVTITGQISGTSCTFDFGTINVSSNTTATITVTDSRGNSTTQTLTITVLNWVLPTAIISAVRESHFYTPTTLTVNADYSSIDGKNEATIRYRYAPIIAQPGSNIFDYSSSYDEHPNSPPSAIDVVLNSDGSLTVSGQYETASPRPLYNIVDTLDITSELEDGATYTLSQTSASPEFYVSVTAVDEQQNTEVYDCTTSGSVTFVVDKSTYTYQIGVYLNVVDYGRYDLFSFTEAFSLVKEGDGTWSGWETIEDNVPTVLQLDNNKAWAIQVRVTDKFGSTTYNLTVSRGMPIQYWDKDKSSVGFNCFPVNDNAVEVENDLLVQGENILSRIAGYGQPAILAPTADWNTAGGTKSGFYMGSNMSNAPGNSTNWFFVLHLVHNNKYMRQLAFDFFSINIWTRRMDNGTWGSWEQVH